MLVGSAGTGPLVPVGKLALARTPAHLAVPAHSLVMKFLLDPRWKSLEHQIK